MISWSESERWLQNLGWSSDPFEHFEASSDPRLGEYLVGHQAFPAAWNQAPALIFAPHGGGKTAACLFTARQAWVERRAFPLIYLPAVHSEFRRPITLERHLEGITRAAAIALFLTLVIRPAYFLGAQPSEQQALVGAFADFLPAELEYYVEWLRGGESPAVLPAHLGTSYLFPEIPSPAQVLILCDALAVAAKKYKSNPSSFSVGRFDTQVSLIRSTTGQFVIDLLVDGIDGAPETFGESASQMEWLAPLIEQAPRWGAEQIYLKAFVPINTRATLRERFKKTLAEFGETEITWTTDKLAELLRQRIYAASGGQVNSLDAYASPDLANIETRIAESVVPLPREALLLTSRVLDNYAARVGDAPGSIEPPDVERALDWYKEDREWVGADRALSDSDVLVTAG
ncbi:MAG: hypothetical protein EYC68_19985 [Chloroflexota bacterium]|nr:MAG: hypothetical protein EYC68_19985 [Chloroflexota bacterium]